MIDSKINILKSIQEASKSTKALHEQFPEFVDRADLSAFLGNLYRSGLIKKYTNGYWKLLDKGEVYLREMASRGPNPEEKWLSSEKLTDQKPAVESKPAPVQPTPIRGTSTAPEQSVTNEFKMWSAIQAVQSVMDQDQKLIIEDDKTYFVFASRRFEIKSKEDLAAAIRVAGLYAGVAA